MDDSSMDPGPTLPTEEVTLQASGEALDLPTVVAQMVAKEGVSPQTEELPLALFEVFARTGSAYRTEELADTITDPGERAMAGPS